MKHTLMVLYIMMLAATVARGQYIMSGKIEYERKIHVLARIKDNLDDDDDDWYQRMKASIPKFNSTYFDLIFDSKRSIYKPGREGDAPPKFWGSDPASENIVFTDLVTKQVRSVKQVYEQKFQVQDTMRKLTWKVKDEIRTIAGYKCRKATSTICDSVFVVAFYTDEIPTNCGPEMFGGLPGMIMELAIPRLHTTWIATKVELTTVKEEDFSMPAKGKKVNSKELYETIQASLKSWGKWASKNVWLTTL